VAGYVVASLGRLPRVGDTVDVEGCRLEVLTVDGRRASRLRAVITRTTGPTEPANP
jgi:putative hemolysin